jgi:hypothetical protein
VAFQRRCIQHRQHDEGERQVPLITVSAGTPAIPAGTYPATLISIVPKRMATAFTNNEEQDFLEWTWQVEAPDKDVEVTSLTSTATGPKSRIFEYLLALVGPEKAAVGAGFDEGDLVGRKVLVGTVVTDQGFAKIDKIVAAPRARAAAPTARVAQSTAAPEDDLPF